jgi:hypothetical protein
MFNRRTLIAAAATLPWLSAHAQVNGLSDAINKAGRQRMLSQRMGKAWLALVQGVEISTAQQVMDKSMSLFDRQLTELKAFSPNPAIQTTYTAMESTWGEYKAMLVGSVPAKSGAANLLHLDAKVLALAQQGTLQYETALNQPVGKLVNIAGRQRMLSQRMAKYYLAATLPVEPGTAIAEIAKARTEFLSAMTTLRTAPQATARIKDELQLADSQWLFFDMALRKLESSDKNEKSMSEVFVSSENLLTIMDRVTGMYSAIKT